MDADTAPHKPYAPQAEQDQPPARLHLKPKAMKQLVEAMRTTRPPSDDPAEDPADDITEIKWIGKRMLKYAVYLFLFALALTALAMASGFPKEATKAYHRVCRDDNKFSATLRNPCCKYFADEENSDCTGQCAEDCRAQTNEMCVDANDHLAELFCFRLMRRLLFQYALCDEDHCAQTMLTVGFGGGGMLWGIWGTFSKVVDVLGFVMGRRLPGSNF